jgi:hypothetical protein
MITVMTSLFNSNIPIVNVFDAEGSTTPDYLESIASSICSTKLDFAKMFGIRNPNTGKWVVPPRIILSNESTLETIWKAIASILRSLPDKVFVDGEWWLLFENTKQNISKFKGRNNTKIGNLYGKIAIPSPDGGTIQALFIIDSYAAMVSKAEESDEGTEALGIEARGHAKHLKKVKTLLKPKHSTLLGVNPLDRKDFQY